MNDSTVALGLKTRPAVARLGACLIRRAWTATALHLSLAALAMTSGGGFFWRLQSPISQPASIYRLQNKKKNKKFCELGVPLLGQSTNRKNLHE